MIDKNKLLLQEAINLISARPLKQDNIDNSVLKLKELKQSLLSSRGDRSLTFNNVADMKKADLNVGDIITTLGYDTVGDNGNAKYEIMDYDTWWNQLPGHVKLVHYHNDRIGCNPVLYKNPVDCYINHILDNGLIASFIKENNTIRVEQGGCIEGRKDNCIALRHIFAYNTTGVIEFGKDKKYKLYYTSNNQCMERENEIISDKPQWLGTVGNNGNEYALILGCRSTTKPCLGRVNNLKLIGNNCTISIPDNEFCKEGSADFALFECGGVIDGLEITGFNFDCNGLKQKGYYVEKVNEDGSTTKEFANMRTCNHTISYFTSGIREDQLTSNSPVDKLGLPHVDFCISLLGDTEFSNVNIHHNNFYANGTVVDTSDGGGDHILIINPTKSENVFIEDNYFENWGRWVFAVDLGGNGERFYNYKFNRNKCVQKENNYIPRANGSKPHRGLGWIDFEARKCFTNLEVCDNYVYGANGWAFNGNGKISENIVIKNNHIERPNFSEWRSIYPYSFTFYSVYPKDLIFENNEIVGGGVGLGKSILNLSMKNNTFTDTGSVLLNLIGNCNIENNTGEGTRGQLFTISSEYPSWIIDSSSEWYIQDRETNILFKNNGKGGVCGDLFKPTNMDYYKNHTLIFEDNHFNKFNCNCWGLKEYSFTADQLNDLITFSARGCTANSPTFTRNVDNHIVGGFHFNEGDLITTNGEVAGRCNGIARFYYEGLGYKIEDFKTKAVYCSKEGYFPTGGEFLMCDMDNWINKDETAVKKGFYYVTLDNLYYCVADGTTKTIPTHTKGIAINGTATLLWLDTIGRIEFRDK